LKKANPEFPAIPRTSPVERISGQVPGHFWEHLKEKQTLLPEMRYRFTPQFQILEFFAEHNLGRINAPLVIAYFADDRHSAAG